VTITTNNVARILLEQRRFAEARALLEPSARSFSSQVLATEPNMAFVLSNLGLIEMEQGNYAAAQADFEQALHAAVVNKHRLHGPILADLADLECRTGHADAGLARLALAQPIVAARYPDEAWRLAQIQNVQAGCLTRAKRYQEAEPLIVVSMPVLLPKWPPDTLYGHDAVQRSVQLYQLTGNPVKLSQYRRLAELKPAAGPGAR
jgi:tetratricopeptide (TPR) repeat protein